MKTFMIALIVALLSSTHGGLAQQESTMRTAIYFAPNVSRLVTATKQGVPLAAFTVPAGAILSVGLRNSVTPSPDANGRLFVHGDVEIRIHATSLRDRAVDLEKAMDTAPILLVAHDVDLEVRR